MTFKKPSIATRWLDDIEYAEIIFVMSGKESYRSLHVLGIKNSILVSKGFLAMVHKNVSMSHCNIKQQCVVSKPHSDDNLRSQSHSSSIEHFVEHETANIQAQHTQIGFVALVIGALQSRCYRQLYTDIDSVHGVRSSPNRYLSSNFALGHARAL